MIPDRLRSIYRRHTHGLRTSATSDDLTFERVELNHYVHVQQVAAWDETTANAVVVFIVDALGDDVPVARVAVSDVSSPFVEAADFWMMEGDILTARFYDGTASDVLHAYAYGVEHTADLEIGE